MYVCICNRITDRDIRRAVSQGAVSMSSLCAQLEIAKNCGRCAECACNILNEELQAQWSITGAAMLASA
ncbi:MAG: (2Fe-2S)-binding protein [Chromatiales bacterium]|nr:(2Fe-2S)-binding protein [Chromatiales bacterium]